jgi:type I restriction enzyme R subunit
MITEYNTEQIALSWFESLGYTIEAGINLSPCEPGAERNDYKQVVLENRLRKAIETINPTVPQEAIADAIRKINHSFYPNLIENNRHFHRMLTEGVDISYMGDSSETYDQIWLIDLDHIENNDWLVVNQLSITGDQTTRRPDVLVFVNGLPLAIIELKNPAGERTTIRQAYDQLQTYKKDIPSLFNYNQLMIISDGTPGPDRFLNLRI